MRLGFCIPRFDELAGLALVARLCAEAEEAGWDGFSSGIRFAGASGRRCR